MLKKDECKLLKFYFQIIMLNNIRYLSKIDWRGMWELNPRGLSTTDLAGLPHTRLGESRTHNYLHVWFQPNILLLFN
jgi:hypothetical protein